MNFRCASEHCLVPPIQALSKLEILHWSTGTTELAPSDYLQESLVVPRSQTHEDITTKAPKHHDMPTISLRLLRDPISLAPSPIPVCNSGHHILPSAAPCMLSPDLTRQTRGRERTKARIIIHVIKVPFTRAFSHPSS